MTSKLTSLDFYKLKNDDVFGEKLRKIFSYLNNMTLINNMYNSISNEFRNDDYYIKYYISRILDPLIGFTFISAGFYKYFVEDAKKNNININVTNIVKNSFQDTITKITKFCYIFNGLNTNINEFQCNDHMYSLCNHFNGICIFKLYDLLTSLSDEITNIITYKKEIFKYLNIDILGYFRTYIQANDGVLDLHRQLDLTNINFSKSIGGIGTGTAHLSKETYQKCLQFHYKLDIKNSSKTIEIIKHVYDTYFKPEISILIDFINLNLPSIKNDVEVEFNKELVKNNTIEWSKYAFTIDPQTNPYCIKNSIPKIRDMTNDAIKAIKNIKNKKITNIHEINANFTRIVQRIVDEYNNNKNKNKGLRNKFSKLLPYYDDSNLKDEDNNDSANDDFNYEDDDDDKKVEISKNLYDLNLVKNVYQYMTSSSEGDAISKYKELLYGSCNEDIINIKHKLLLEIMLNNKKLWLRNDNPYSDCTKYNPSKKYNVCIDNVVIFICTIFVKQFYKQIAELPDDDDKYMTESFSYRILLIYFVYKSLLVLFGWKSKHNNIQFYEESLPNNDHEATEKNQLFTIMLDAIFITCYNVYTKSNDINKGILII